MSHPTRPQFNADIFISEVENGYHIDFDAHFREVLEHKIPNYRRELVHDITFFTRPVGATIDELISDACEYASGYQFNNESE